MTGFSPWLQAHLATLSVWIGAFCTLGLYSILYKENKIYRFFEHLYLGLATGYLIANTWTDILQPKWYQPMWEGKVVNGVPGAGQWPLIFTVAAGSLYYFIYSKKHNWLARLIIGFFLGIASGQTFQAFVNDTWPQIPTSFKPILPHAEIAAVNIPAPPGHPASEAIIQPAIKAVTGPDAINNVIFMLILLCVMSYFFFSFEQKSRFLKGTAQWGRWLLMFAFGAIFGSTIMGRLALLIDRVDYLLNDFGGAVAGPSAGPKVVFALLMALIALVLYLATRPGANAEEPGEGSP